jgi:uncharacterized protein
MAHGFRRRTWRRIADEGDPVIHGTGADRVTASFGAHAELASRVLAALGNAPAGSDGSHDLSHLLRVWRNAEAIARTEPDCDVPLLVSAVLLHDCVAVEKNSPHRAAASRLSAARAVEIVRVLGWDAARIAALRHAIEAHSFTSGLAPATLEARILRDADRLDAIGAIGIARCFYVAGRMGSALYDPDDFDATSRDVDDRRYAVDHFKAKLFRVAEEFCTRAGQVMAAERSAVMRRFVDAFRNEVET